MRTVVNKVIVLLVSLILSISSWGQNNLSITTSVIRSNVKIKDNWTPMTAPNYKEYLNGSAFGYGANLSYSFHPTFILRNSFKQVLLNIGIGYFKQEFDVKRPFNYSSPVQIIYRSKNYSYECWSWMGGLSYTIPIKIKYTMIINLAYNQLESFKQYYSPTSGDPTQVNNHSIDFSKMVLLSLGLQRAFRHNISIGLNLVLPYAWWRNDAIFNDNPSTFTHSGFSIGSSLSLVYLLKK